MVVPRVVALVGPTGAGKTELGIALAQHFDAEIVNADSRQVYRRLDIGSAKPTPEQQAAVRHHLIDVVDPDESFDCARFRQLALAAIADITARGKRVLVVGGTGLYIKVLRSGVFEGPSRDPILRHQLEAAEAQSPGTLHARLRSVDPDSAARLHAHDRMRLIRALEVFELTGRPISVWQREHAFRDQALSLRTLALQLPRAELYRRINARCTEMVRVGLIEEVRQLFAAGYAPQLPSLQSPGYREVGEYVRGVCDLATAVARMAQATRHLAKRQLTWFRGNRETIWCAADMEELSRQTEPFLS